jgi:CubicO group peptidase (beta-lactamase class C family)
MSRTQQLSAAFSRRSFVAFLAAGAATTLLAPGGAARAASGGDAPGQPDPAGARAVGNDFRALGWVVGGLMAELGVPGVAVGVLHGDREHAAGFGVTNVEHPLPVDADTLFQIGSVTKTYTGTALMRLVEAGALDLDAPVRRWVPGLALADPAVAAAVTPRHLVTHTGGWFGDYMPDTGSGDDALARYVAGLAALPQQAPLGRFFAYSNAGFSLAGRVIEAATGLPYEAAIGELLLAPLGLARSTFFAADAITHAVAVGHTAGEAGPRVARPWALPRGVNPAGGLIASVREQLAWARFHLGDGAAPSGARLLAPATLALMQSPLGPGGSLGLEEIEGIGVAWQLASAGGVRTIAHGGDTVGQHAAFLLVPERRFALVILANADTGPLLAGEVATWALRRFLGLARPTPQPVPLPVGEVAAAVGRYASPALELGVGAGDGVLILRVLDRGVPVPEFPAVRFAACGEDRFVALDEPVRGVRCDLLRRPDGTVGWLRYGGRLLVRDATPGAASRGIRAGERSGRSWPLGKFS